MHSGMLHVLLPSPSLVLLLSWLCSLLMGSASAGRRKTLFRFACTVNTVSVVMCLVTIMDIVLMAASVTIMFWFHSHIINAQSISMALRTLRYAACTLANIVTITLLIGKPSASYCISLGHSTYIRTDSNTLMSVITSFISRAEQGLQVSCWVSDVPVPVLSLLVLLLL